MNSFSNQHGYGRLTAGTVILSITVISVLIYQFFAFRDAVPTTSISQTPVDAISSVQLFPQTLPVLQDIGYLLEVRDSEGKEFQFQPFFHKSSGVLTTSTGSRIVNGIFPLPPEITNVVSSEISLFDNRNQRAPVVISLLSGAVNGSRALLEFKVNGLDQSTGKYSLGTPTDNNTLINERSGLWYGDIIQNQSFLDLPNLPRGWVYEGWVIIGDQPLTTGRFSDPNQSDLFSGFSDKKAEPPDFPGEDFLVDPPVDVFQGLFFPVDLAGQKTVITIEPDHNGLDPTGQGPFPIKLFDSNISKLAQAGVLYDLDSAIDQFPKSTLVVR